MSLQWIAPSFWQKHNVWTTLLRPASWLYRGGVLLHQIFQKRFPALPVPVVCIGNIVAGGAGKTPATLLLAEELSNQGHQVHVVLRGYGGKISEATRVNLDHHTWQEVGDEACLYAKKGLPTWIGASRYALAQAACNAGATVVLCDDGLQDHSMPYSHRVLVIDASYGLGNGLVFPAGPLREPLSRVLSRLTGIIGIGYKTTPFPSTSCWFISAERKCLFPPEVDRTKPVFAFAGLGNPSQFFQSLTRHGLNLIETIAFPDHHPYSLKEIEGIIFRAQQKGVQIITTQKDFLRLPQKTRKEIIPIDLILSLEGEKLLTRVLFSLP